MGPGGPAGGLDLQLEAINTLYNLCWQSRVRMEKAVAAGAVRPLCMYVRVAGGWTKASQFFVHNHHHGMVFTHIFVGAAFVPCSGYRGTR